MTYQQYFGQVEANTAMRQGHNAPVIKKCPIDDLSVIFWLSKGQ